MRHRVKRNRLSRAKDQREALLRSLTTDLLRHDEIVTTLSKAKALRIQAEKMITLGKRGYVEDYTGVREKAKAGDKDAQKQIAKSVHMRRQVASYLRDRHKQKTIIEHRHALKEVLRKPFAEKGIKGSEALSKAVRELALNEKELKEMLPNPDAAKSLVLRDRDVVYRVFNTLAPRYKDRQGGYTRIVKLGFRAGDAAEMALIQLV